VTPEALTVAATRIVEGMRVDDPHEVVRWLRRVLGRVAFQRLKQAIARVPDNP
jgi:hypothetical protein